MAGLGEGASELWRVMLALLGASWAAVGYRYGELTPQERELMTPEQHARLVLLMRSWPVKVEDALGVRAAQLVERAVLYAQAGIEGLELRSQDEFMSAYYKPADAVADMEAITAHMARAFVVGYGAAIDDQTVPPRLGGVSEDERKAVRRKGKGKRR